LWTPNKIEIVVPLGIFITEKLRSYFFDTFFADDCVEMAFPFLINERRRREMASFVTSPYFDRENGNYQERRENKE